jgi:hypothetical protein
MGKRYDDTATEIQEVLLRVGGYRDRFCMSTNFSVKIFSAALSQVTLSSLGMGGSRKEKNRGEASVKKSLLLSFI